MCKENNTDLSVWLSMPIIEFCRWLRASNELVQAERKAIEEARRKRG